MTTSMSEGGAAMKRSTKADFDVLMNDNIDVRRRRSHEAFHQGGLAPVRSEVTRVEDAFSLHLDQQHMGVKGTVIGQVRRNSKPPHLERRPALPGSEVPINTLAENSRGQLDQALGCFPAEYGPVAGRFLQQAVMILMWMRYEYPVHWRLEIQRCRQQSGGLVRRVQGPTHIQDNAMVAGGDLDAITADLISRPMDGEPNFVH